MEDLFKISIRSSARLAKFGKTLTRMNPTNVLFHISSQGIAIIAKSHNCDAGCSIFIGVDDAETFERNDTLGGNSLYYEIPFTKDTVEIATDSPVTLASLGTQDSGRGFRSILPSFNKNALAVTFSATVDTSNVLHINTSGAKYTIRDECTACNDPNEAPEYYESLVQDLDPSTADTTETIKESSKIFSKELANVMRVDKNSTQESAKIICNPNLHTITIPAAPGTTFVYEAEKPSTINGNDMQPEIPITVAKSRFICIKDFIGAAGESVSISIKKNTRIVIESRVDDAKFTIMIHHHSSANETQLQM